MDHSGSISIIWPPPISISSMLMPAPSKSHTQASATTSARLPSTTARSWRSAAKNQSAVIATSGRQRTGREARLVDNALVAEVEMRELTVSADEIGKVNTSGGSGRAAADLGDAELEPVWQIDAHAMLGARYRVLDRLAD